MMERLLRLCYNNTDIDNRGDVFAKVQKRSPR